MTHTIAIEILCLAILAYNAYSYFSSIGSLTDFTEVFYTPLMVGATQFKGGSY